MIVICVTVITQAAGDSVASRFDTAASRTIQVTMESDAAQRSAAVAELKRLPGVAAVGLLTQGAAAGAAQVGLLDAPERTNAPVVFADGAGLAAVKSALLAGRIPETLTANQVIVGDALARQLGVWPEQGRDRFVVGDDSVSVVAVIEDGDDRALLTSAVVLDPSQAHLVSVESTYWTLVVATMAGYGQVVADALPLALAPEEPDTISVGRPPDPRELRRRISADNRSLSRYVAVMSMGAAILGLAATMASGVRERRNEIGIRMALGTRRTAIASQFLIEATLIGLLGGLAGYAMGVIAAAAACLWQGWQLTIEPWLLAVPLLSTTAAAAAALIPAWRASAVRPAEALAF